MAQEVEERFMQARHLALKGKELCVSQMGVQETKTGLLLNSQPKISRICGELIAGKKKEK